MAAAAAKVPITAIFNPDSGPVAGPPSAAYTAAFTQLEAAGGKVVAYVYTDNGNADGTASLSKVEGEISTYISQYGSLINGFLLDGTLITPSTLSYYVALQSYIKGLSPSYRSGAPPTPVSVTAYHSWGLPVDGRCVQSFRGYHCRVQHVSFRPDLV